MSARSLIYGLVGAAALASSASAATLTFGPTGWASDIDWTATIDDETDGFWTVTLAANGAPGTDIGDILGFGFDTTLAGLGLGSLSVVSSTTGEQITGLYANTTSCGTGCNFNGGTAAFDYIVRFGTTGTSNGRMTDAVFRIATTADLLADSVTRVGFRAQGVGDFPNGGNGSVKDVVSTGTYVPTPPPAPVPLPAAGWLLAAGVAGLGALRRARSAR